MWRVARCPYAVFVSVRGFYLVAEIAKASQILCSLHRSLVCALIAVGYEYKSLVENRHAHLEIPLLVQKTLRRLYAHEAKTRSLVHNVQCL